MGLKIPVIDRIPTYPGRVKLTPVSGQTNTYDLVRADSPVAEGTPINKVLLDNKAYTVTANATVYVNGSSGNDSTGDGSSGKPFKTIQAAIDSIPKCLGGYIVNVDIAAGTYSERVRIEGFYGGRLIVGNTDRTITTLGVTVMATQYVQLCISNVTAVGGDGATLLYIGNSSNVVLGRHMTLDCNNTVQIGVGVEVNSALAAIGVSLNVNKSTAVAVLAKDNSRVSLNIVGGSNNTGVGLKAENGSLLSYVTKSIAATTATLTVGGAKIFSGAQTSIPNY